MSADLREALERSAELAPTGAEPQELWERAGRANRRGRLFVAAAVVATAVGGGLVWNGADDLTRSTPPASPTHTEGTLGLPDQLYAVPERLHTTDEVGPIGPLAVVGEAIHVPVDRPLGTDGTQMAYGVSSASGEYRYLSLPGRGGSDALIREVWVSPDGSYVIYPHYVDQAARNSDGVAVYDATSGDTRVVPIESLNGVLVESATWSPDGTQVALTIGVADPSGEKSVTYTGGNIEVLTPSTGRVREVPGTAKYREDLTGWRAAPTGGTQLTFSTDAGSFIALDPATGEEVERIERPAALDYALGPVAWSPDGTAFAVVTYCQDSDQCTTQDIVTGVVADGPQDGVAKPVISLSKPLATGDSVAVIGWSDDDHVIAYLEGDVPGLYAIDRGDAGEPVLLTAGTLPERALSNVATVLLGGETVSGQEPHGLLRPLTLELWLYLGGLALFIVGRAIYLHRTVWRRQGRSAEAPSFAGYLWASNPEVLALLLTLVGFSASVLASRFLIPQVLSNEATSYAFAPLWLLPALWLSNGRLMVPAWLVLVGVDLTVISHYALNVHDFDWPQVVVPALYALALVLLLAPALTRPVRAMLADLNVRDAAPSE